MLDYAKQATNYSSRKLSSLAIGKPNTSLAQRIARHHSTSYAGVSPHSTVAYGGEVVRTVAVVGAACGGSVACFFAVAESGRHGAARRGKRWLSSLFTSFTELASSSALHLHVAQSISVALYYVQRYKAHVASSSYVAVVCSAEKAKVRPLALLHTLPRLALLPVTHTQAWLLQQQPTLVPQLRLLCECLPYSMVQISGPSPNLPYVGNVRRVLYILCVGSSCCLHLFKRCENRQLWFMIN